MRLLIAMLIGTLLSCAANTQESPDVTRDVTVEQVVKDEALVGMKVKVEGRCLGYGSVAAVGPPPRTRSDWQLADGDAAVWVAGPLPEGCSATEGSLQNTAVVGVVQQDTLARLGSDPPIVRRFIALIVGEHGDNGL